MSNMENYKEKSKEIEEKLHQETKKLDGIFDNRDPKSNVTYEDLSTIVTALLNINYLFIQNRQCVESKYVEIFLDSIDKIYENMYKLHGIIPKKDLTNS